MGSGARRRLAAAACGLAPLPLATVAFLVAGAGAGPAEALRAGVVEIREGDVWVGAAQVTRTAADESWPDWAPDRRRVVFARQEPKERGSRIVVARRDGGGVDELTSGRFVDIQPTWSPDGQRIAFARSPLRGGSFDVYVVDARGGQPQLVKGGPADQVAPRWQNGRVVATPLDPAAPFQEKLRDSGTPLSGPRELLPDFDQRPPFRLTVAGTRLGFASATDNIGEGAIRIRGVRTSSREPMRVVQVVSLTGGEERIYRQVGRVRYTPSPTHTHWHVLDFQRYELRRLDGSFVVRDRKTGFCLADHYGLAARWVEEFRGPRFLSNCASGQPHALAVDQGTSPGYTDLYPPHFHGQNIELRGVPAGDYVLVHRANAQELLEELDYTNNAASLRIRLTWSGGSPRVRVLRTCPASDRC